MLFVRRLNGDAEPLADLPLPRHLFLPISGRLAVSDVKSDVAPKQPDNLLPPNPRKQRAAAPCSR